MLPFTLFCFITTVILVFSHCDANEKKKFTNHNQIQRNGDAENIISPNIRTGNEALDDIYLTNRFRTICLTRNNNDFSNLIPNQFIDTPKRRKSKYFWYNWLNKAGRKNKPSGARQLNKNNYVAANINLPYSRIMGYWFFKNAIRKPPSRSDNKRFNTKQVPTLHSTWFRIYRNKRGLLEKAHELIRNERKRNKTLSDPLMSRKGPFRDEISNRILVGVGNENNFHYLYRNFFWLGTPGPGKPFVLVRRGDKNEQLTENKKLPGNRLKSIWLLHDYKPPGRRFLKLEKSNIMTTPYGTVKYGRRFGKSQLFLLNKYLLNKLAVDGIRGIWFTTKRKYWPIGQRSGQERSQEREEWLDVKSNTYPNAFIEQLLEKAKTKNPAGRLHSTWFRGGLVQSANDNMMLLSSKLSEHRRFRTAISVNANEKKKFTNHNQIQRNGDAENIISPNIRTGNEALDDIYLTNRFRTICLTHNNNDFSNLIPNQFIDTPKRRESKYLWYNWLNKAGRKNKPSGARQLNKNNNVAANINLPYSRIMGYWFFKNAIRKPSSRSDNKRFNTKQVPTLHSTWFRIYRNKRGLLEKAHELIRNGRKRNKTLSDPLISRKGPFKDEISNRILVGVGNENNFHYLYRNFLLWIGKPSKPLVLVRRGDKNEQLTDNKKLPGNRLKSIWLLHDYKPPGKRFLKLEKSNIMTTPYGTVKYGRRFGKSQLFLLNKYLLNKLAVDGIRGIWFTTKRKYWPIGQRSGQERSQEGEEWLDVKSNIYPNAFIEQLLEKAKTKNPAGRLHSTWFREGLVQSANDNVMLPSSKLSGNKRFRRAISVNKKKNLDVRLKKYWFATKRNSDIAHRFLIESDGPTEKPINKNDDNRKENNDNINENGDNKNGNDDNKNENNVDNNESDKIIIQSRNFWHFIFPARPPKLLHLVRIQNDAIKNEEIKSLERPQMFLILRKVT